MQPAKSRVPFLDIRAANAPLRARLDAIGELAALCREHFVLLVEDAAQAHGAAIGARRAGSFGTAACFSFYPAKNLGCFGDGGAGDIELPGVDAGPAHAGGATPSDRLAATVLSLPTGPHLADEQVEIVCEAVRGYFR
jgi:dTDP-4-amino-4,6-dideoxygalactose transaminase